MDTSYHTSLELNQKQQLSQSQIQSLNILSLDNGELSEFLQNEYIENPILDYSPPSSSPAVSDARAFDIPAENTEEVKTFLLDQLNQSDFTQTEWMTMKFMIDCLDSGGFFRISLHELSVLLTIPEKVIKKCYDVLSDLEPAGIFSENLSQCLLKQLETKGEKTDILEKIISEHLDNIALGHISTISRSLKISTAKVRKNIAVIRNLNSKPLQGFSTAKTEYITPDIIVTFQEDQWEIQLNDDWVGNYSLNDYYIKMLKDTKDPELKEYFQKKYERCRFLMASIEQRRHTMVKITEAVLARQPDFFLNHGCLKPMTMNDVAEDIDMHVSTVSRGIKGKYLQFPCGIVSMRSLFTGARPCSGASVSSTDIKTILKELVASEDPRKPFSDQKLSILLKEKGISISRRTVAKYREQMGIKGTYDRKES
ncbi:RNA polymerase factor sigma-54 [Anaerostipes sp.]|uniref:RNA polymerase factor sigma-54 n=1 Tax=Anaerostipes sp. TaxID=1872530 RepID=UPI0025BFE3AA|nr:RNA polymerase factor sigma-54 [Anaerostipes sp.]MBS7009548.1 RNA polymerase factor sigma-54 [Anaerostipes sp.]